MDQDKHNYDPKAIGLAHDTLRGIYFFQDRSPPPDLHRTLTEILTAFGETGYCSDLGTSLGCPRADSVILAGAATILARGNDIKEYLAGISDFVGFELEALNKIKGRVPRTRDQASDRIFIAPEIRIPRVINHLIDYTLLKSR